MTEKFIGTSFSRCLFSLARGEINLDMVAFILTSTAYPSRDVMLEQVRQTMMGRNVETHLANAAELWDSGRIYQASTRSPAHVTEDQPIWIEAPAVLGGIADEEDDDDTLFYGRVNEQGFIEIGEPVKMQPTQKEDDNFASFIEWGKANGLHPSIGSYLSEKGNFAGATPKEWTDLSNVISHPSFNALDGAAKKSMLTVINEEALKAFDGWIKDIVKNMLI